MEFVVMLIHAALLIFTFKPICGESTPNTLSAAAAQSAREASTGLPVETSTKEIDKRLFYKIKDVALDCAKKNGIDVDVCLEMFNEYQDLREPKYHQCKCWIPCVAQELDLMKNDENYNLDSIRGLINQLETKPWRNEASRIFELCTDEGGTGCEGGFNIVSCMLDHSDKAVQTAKNLLFAVKDGMQ